MSDQAKLFLLQRKLDEIKKARRNITLYGITGVIVFGLIWNFYKLDWNIGLMIAVGVGLFVALPLATKYSRQESAILWEIQQMATVILTCANCKREIPQGNFEFCPFCGNPIKV